MSDERQQSNEGRGLATFFVDWGWMVMNGEFREINRPGDLVVWSDELYRFPKAGE